MLFIADTGCRVSEAVITLGDLDLDKNIVVIHGKGRRIRPMFFIDFTAEALREWLSCPQRKHWAEKFPDHVSYVFLGRCGHLTDSGLRYIIRGIGKEARIDLCPHQLRHTLAILTLEKGAPTAVVSKLMGHRSIQTTVDIYSIFTLSRLKEQHEIYSPVAQAADFLSEAFFRKRMSRF